MGTFLFDSLVFGPVYSRRLGISLGINVLPVNSKVCNFNCIYCECGWTFCNADTAKLPSASAIRHELLVKLRKFREAGKEIHTITFAGNGEPTIHPEFDKIIEDTAELRDEFYPGVNIAVLSNATLVNKKKVLEALKTVDLNILKMDSAITETLQLINQPPKNFTVEKLISGLKQFNGQFILQTLFLKGEYKGKVVDNTSKKERIAWLNAVEEIKPMMVMIYTIRRDTPYSGLQPVTYTELERISENVQKLGIKTQISD